MQNLKVQSSSQKLKVKIAVIIFPGINTEHETRREINRAGMQAEFFRWNESAEKLKKYDGYVIGGGFTYEDRGRAGVIASLDPIMKTIKEEAEKGKPVLGICNGAQALVETGLIPGADGLKPAMALARNKRIRNGEVLGTGYYNVWSHMKCAVKKDSCMFTLNIDEGEILHCPIAHGEGRFTSEIPDLMQKLQGKGQMVFRYCDRNGVIVEDFPINPNGAMYNLAAVCNPRGNVMAMMPHPERARKASEKIFTSMRDAILDSRKEKSVKRTPRLTIKPLPCWPLADYQTPNKVVQFFVSLIITDNEAETHELTLKELGWPNIKLKRMTHFEISLKGKPDMQKTCKKLIQSGILLNTNKEIAKVKFKKETLLFDSRKECFNAQTKQTPNTEETVLSMLVREKQDFIGMAKLAVLRHRLKMEEIADIKTGVLWEFAIPSKSITAAQNALKKIAGTHLFFNPHRQDAFLFQ